jgi:uncharacterized protein (TIGR03067 family)
MYRNYVLLIVALAVPALRAADEEPVGKELEALQGKWKLIGTELRGQAPASFQPFEIVFGPKGKALFRPEGMEIEISWAIDAKKSPKTITLTNGAQKHFGIYKLEDGKVTICMTRSDAAEKDRPREFKTKDTEYQMWVLEPVKGGKK